MADEKSLKFGTKLDASGIKQMQSGLKDLKTGLEQFNKSLSALNAGFASLTKELKGKVKDLASFKSEIVNTGKEIKGQVKAVNEYTEALKRLSTALNARNRGSRGSSAGTGAMGAMGGAALGSNMFPSAGSAANMRTGGSPGSPLFVHVVGNNAGGGGGGFGGGGGNGAGTQLVPAPGGGFGVVPPRGGGGGGGNQPNQEMMRVSRAIQQLASMGQTAANFIQEMKTAPMASEAAAKATRGGMFKAMLGGDLSGVLSMNQAIRQGSSPLEQFGGRKAMGAGTLLGATGEAAGGLATGNIAGGVSGIAGGVGTVVGAVARGTWQKMEAETVQRGLELQKQLDPVQQAVFQNFMANAPDLLQANRRLGGKGMKAAGMGAGAGMMPTEAMQFMTSGANKFGAATMMGGAGVTTSSTTGATSIEAAWQRASTVNPRTGMRMFHPSQKHQFLNSPSMQAAAGSSAGTTTSSTSGGFQGLGGRALDFQKKGFDANTMVQLMGGMQGGMQGGTGQRLDAAQRILTEAMASGVKRGIQDVQTLEALGTAIAEKSMDASIVQQGGGVGIGRLASALTVGLTGETATPQRITERMQGMEAIGQAIQSNPFLFNRSMARSQNILGGGAGVAQTTALATASPADLMMEGQGGMAAGALGVMGITSAQAREQLTSNATDVIQRAIAADPELRKMVGDQDPLTAIQNESIRKRAAVSLSFTTGGFSDWRKNLRGFEGFTGIAGGANVSGNAEAMQLLGGMKNQGGMALGAQQSQAAVQLKALTEAFTEKNVQAFSDVFRSTGQVFEVLAKLPQGGLEDTVEVMKALEHLILVLQATDTKKVKDLEAKFKMKVK